jgi:hypothetical protein
LNALDYIFISLFDFQLFITVATRLFEMELKYLEAAGMWTNLYVNAVAVRANTIHVNFCFIQSIDWIWFSDRLDAKINVSSLQAQFDEM